MPGLYISLPAADERRKETLAALLHDFDLPLAAFTRTAPAFPEELPRPAFLRAASIAVLLGQPVPGETLRRLLSGGDPLPANVLRRHLFLRLSLMPYLRPGRTVTQLDGALLAGRELLIVPVSADDTVDAPLPPGVWTELNGTPHSGRLRCMRGYNETPLLLRENTLLPVGMNGQSLTQTTQEDADRLTLHWFQPGNEAECVLADGTRYHVQRRGEQIDVHADTEKPFHLIAHENGVETLLR